jgi:hypothetical protein
LPTLVIGPLAAVLAGGVLGGDEADDGHELLGSLEAAEVADLGHECRRERIERACRSSPPSPS